MQVFLARSDASPCPVALRPVVCIRLGCSVAKHRVNLRHTSGEPIWQNLVLRLSEELIVV